MTLWRLVLRNVLGSLFRSGAIVACAALVAGLSLSATLVVREAEGGLRRNLSRMGADIQVIPWGTMAPEFDGAHLVGMMTQRWMPRAYLERIARVEGVEAVTPQLFISTLNAPGPAGAGGRGASDSYGAVGVGSSYDPAAAEAKSVARHPLARLPTLCSSPGWSTIRWGRCAWERLWPGWTCSTTATMASSRPTAIP